MVTACTTAGGGRAPGGPTVPRGCEPSDSFEPGAASFAELVDSAAFVRAVQPRWDPSWGRTAARLWVPPDASPPIIEVYAQTDPAVLDWLADRLREHRTERPLPGGAVSMILSMDGSLGPMTVHELRRCAPEILNRDEFTRLLSALRSNLEDELPATTLDTTLYIHVDRSGQVTAVRVLEASRSRDFDESIRQVAFTLRLRPGYVEGVPSATGFGLPIRLPRQ